MKDEILTIEQVARFFQMKPQTIYKWAQEGKIPGVKLGKEWRFRKDMIDEWLDTSIALSKGGFEFMLNRTQLNIKRSDSSGQNIDNLIDKTLRGPDQK